MSPEARRILGIDLGERRIGVAEGNPATGVVAPLATLRRSRAPQQDARTIARLAGERQAAELIVGLPLNADGSEGPQAARTREWGAAVAAETGLPLRFWDERLTSERAEQRIGGTARGRSGGPPTAAQREAYRARVDREAAALILQDYFDARTATTPGNVESPGDTATGTATSPTAEDHHSR